MSSIRNGSCLLRPVTSASNAGTSALPRDKTQEEIKEGGES
jgi:hypothetical protein